MLDNHLKRLEMKRLEKPFRILSSLAATALSLAALATPASADWLQTRRGALVETRGPWKVKGPIVLFTSTSGTLSSLRLSEVDLDASAVATIEALEVIEAPESEDAPESVLVLTNKDIPRAGSVIAQAEDEDAEDEEGEGEDGESSPESEPPPAEPVTVVSWNPSQRADGGLELTGILMNLGENIASNLRVLVRLYDDDGDLLGSSNAFLTALSLAPTSSARFRALFPEVTEASITPEFEVKSSTIRVEAVLMDEAPGNES